MDRKTLIEPEALRSLAQRSGRIDRVLVGDTLNEAARELEMLRRLKPAILALVREDQDGRWIATQSKGSDVTALVGPALKALLTD